MAPKHSTQRFLIERYDTFTTKGWTSWVWWLQHLPSIVSTVKSLERGECDGILLDEHGICCVTNAELRALDDEYWRTTGGPELVEKMADGLMEKIQHHEAEKVACLRQPGPN